MESELENYSILRDIPVETIEVMKEKKICMQTIKLMEPQALEKFIPKIGDRLAILDDCTREMDFRNKKKGSLLEKLRSKLKNKEEDANLHPVAAGKNKPAMKMTRMVDIGWLNFENGRLIQFIPLHVKSKLQLEIYLPNGDQEKAEDLGGVSRDVLSEFWEEFINKLTVGTHARVPILRHDFDGIKWTSVAKILAKGLLEESYSPVRLSKSFIEYCIFGKNLSNITEDLLRFVSDMDSELFSLAMKNFNEVDHSELLECLDNLDCKWQPSQENIGKLLEDSVHKEIIQKPMFIINQWHSVLKDIISPQQFEEIYAKQKNLPRIL
ncbi:hypothetical protein JTB14_023048 [Gonioctena quinquepunctata]|nr:hypothetical protein JTB14_023048 [Gonioctena quinquepunctata]